MDIVIVKPGDTLYGIARRTGTTVDNLAYINQLNDPSRLVPNMALLVPGPERPDRQEILVNAYAYPGISDATLNETLPYLSFLCPFSNRLTLDGDLVTIDDGRLVEAALAQNAAPFLTVTNLSESGGFSSDIAHAVFTDRAVQDAAVEKIFAALSRRRYAGVNLNIEYVYPFDRESYNQFLRRLSGLLHERGWYLTTAIAPKESADQEGLLYTAHDYAAHGRWADWVVLMTYEWGYTYSAPQAVSPVNRIRRVLDYAVTQMPVGSILLGLSNYGHWARLYLHHTHHRGYRRAPALGGLRRGQGTQGNRCATDCRWRHPLFRRYRQGTRCRSAFSDAGRHVCRRRRIAGRHDHF